MRDLGLSQFKPLSDSLLQALDNDGDEQRLRARKMPVNRARTDVRPFAAAFDRLDGLLDGLRDEFPLDRLQRPTDVRQASSTGGAADCSRRSSTA